MMALNAPPECSTLTVTPSTPKAHRACGSAPSDTTVEGFTNTCTRLASERFEQLASTLLAASSPSSAKRQKVEHSAADVAKSGVEEVACACAKLEASADEHHGQSLLELPEEVLHFLLEYLNDKDLCKLASSCRRLAKITSCELRWRKLYSDRYGSLHGLPTRAAKIAGGWKQLFINKSQALRKSAPWVTPGNYEVSALIESMRNPSGKSLGVIFLVDGSGSVSEPDFNTMTTFVKDAVVQLDKDHEELHVGILQFSDEVRTELELSVMEQVRFATVVDSMVRMNGGTNIASALMQAQQMFEENIEDIKNDNGVSDYSLQPPEHHVVVLLTDGRLDGTQSSEAMLKAKQIAMTVPNMSLYALGVGRSIDQVSMRNLVIAGDSINARSNVELPLYTRSCRVALGRPDSYNMIDRGSIADTRYLGLRILQTTNW